MNSYYVGPGHHVPSPDQCQSRISRKVNGYYSDPYDYTLTSPNSYHRSPDVMHDNMIQNLNQNRSRYREIKKEDFKLNIHDNKFKALVLGSFALILILVLTVHFSSRILGKKKK